MKNEKLSKPEQPELHEPPKKKKEKEKRKKHRRAPFVIIFLLIIAALVFLFFNPLGWGGGGAFGLGGKNNSENVSDSGGQGSQSSEDLNSDTLLITITDEEIYFNGELCDVNELEEKITELGTSKKYELEHSKAIKSAYDSVKSVLVKLEDSLGITVNYNE